MAADAPRWRYIARLDVAAEPEIGQDTITALLARSHRIVIKPPMRAMVSVVPGGSKAAISPAPIRARMVWCGL
jgi:hypothetical protein